MKQMNATQAFSTKRITFSGKVSKSGCVKEASASWRDVKRADLWLGLLRIWLMGSLFNKRTPQCVAAAPGVDIFPPWIFRSDLLTHWVPRKSLVEIPWHKSLNYVQDTDLFANNKGKIHKKCKFFKHVSCRRLASNVIKINIGAYSNLHQQQRLTLFQIFG